MIRLKVGKKCHGMAGKWTLIPKDKFQKKQTDDSDDVSDTEHTCI